MSLTPRQQQILTLVKDTYSTKGRPPSLTELWTATGVDPVVIVGHLRDLRSMGAITLDTVGRGISVEDLTPLRTAVHDEAERQEQEVYDGRLQEWWSA
jgi:SOS-response transcriptional repressor LexA